MKRNSLSVFKTMWMVLLAWTAVFSTVLTTPALAQAESDTVRMTLKLERPVYFSPGDVIRGGFIIKTTYANEVYVDWGDEKDPGRYTLNPDRDGKAVIRHEYKNHGTYNIKLWTEGGERLTYFYAVGDDVRALTSLDVSGCTVLRELWCDSNQLTTLNVSNCSFLEQLYCDSNQLTTLDVSTCPRLMTLTCQGNRLESLKVNTALRLLNCSSNRLTELDVRDCRDLTFLWCGENRLTVLDVHDHRSLTLLDCGMNSLVSLYISGCTALQKLGCINNRLTELKVSGFNNLEVLSCDYNNLTILDASGCTKLGTMQYSEFGPTSGSMLTFSGNPLENLNVSGCIKLSELSLFGVPSLKNLDVSGCKLLGSLNLSALSSLMDLNASGCELLGSLNFGDRGISSLKSLNISGTPLSNLNLTGCTTLEHLNASGCKSLGNLNFSRPYGMGISSLKSLDLSGCMRMTELECSNNQLETLNVSGCVSLSGLKIENNPLVNLNASGCKSLARLNFSSPPYGMGISLLRRLDLSGCEKLEELTCPGNRLTDLKVNGCGSLRALDCRSNQLTNLDVSSCRGLITFMCNGNKLDRLDVSLCMDLKILNCADNSLTTLDVSNCTNLTDLICSGNRLTSLNVRGLNQLRELNCSNNNKQLGELNVSLCTKLEKLDCSDNKLKTLNVSGCSALYHLNCHDNLFKNLDVSGCTTLKVLDCSNNIQLDSLNISGCTSLTTFNCTKNSSMTMLDASGCTSLRGFSGWENISSLKNLNVSGCMVLNDLNLSGISSLESLNASGCTSLGSLDMSTCTALRELRCSGNAWQTLDISRCTELEVLDCSSNQLTSLDLRNREALRTLDCSENRLIDLDVSGCKALSSLNFGGNPSLTTLDASGCISLSSLEIHQSLPSLTTLNLSGCTDLSSLDFEEMGISSLKKLDISGCTALEFLYCPRNQLTSLDASRCILLGSLNVSRMGSLKKLDVSGCTELTELSCSKNKLDSLDVSGCTALSSLSCDNNPLGTLNVSGCTSLTTLNCFNNQLDSLNVSGCRALESLYCYNNQLKSLDVSGCTELIMMDCSSNQLDSLNVSGCTSLNWLSCSMNQLSSLNIIRCTKLEHLNCGNNQLDSLNVSGCTALKILYCGDNKLTTLDISGCRILTTLMCNNNQLKSLDLSGNEQCQAVWCNFNHIPLSSLYPLMARLNTSDVGFAFYLSPQSDTVQLAGGEVFDLSSEMHLGNAGIPTEWSVQNLDGAAVADGTFEENDGLFRFLKQGDYRLVLQNDVVRQYLYDGSSMDESAVVFTWVVKVLSDAAYQISVQSNNDAWGSVSGGGRKPSGDSIMIAASAKPNYRFVKWVHTGTEQVFTTRQDTSFKVSETLNLTAVFELIPTYTISVQPNKTAWGSVSISGSNPYQENANVTITATRKKGYYFVKWVHSGTENVFTTKSDTAFRATQNLNLTAVFAEIIYDITLQSNNAAYGEVSRDGSYKEDSVVVIDATPKAGYHFVKWVHTGTNNVFTRVKRHTFKATQHLALTAVFADTIGALRVEVLPNSVMMGETVITGDGIYKRGDSVSISAKAKIGFRFTDWKRAKDGERVFFADSTKKDTTFVVTENMSLVAYFRNVPPHTIEVRANNDDWGEVSGGGASVPENAEVTIGATPNEGYRFVNWTHLVYNGGSVPDKEVFGTSADTTFEAVQNLTLTANFELIPIPTYTIELNVNNAAYGKVSGSGTYKEDSVVVIAASPNEGYRFIAWKKGEDVFSLEATHTFNATENLSLTAYFEQVPFFNVTLSVNDSTWGRVTGEGLYKENAEVRIKATPNKGYKFVNWKKGEEVFALSADTAFRITEDISLRATFDSLPKTDTVTPPAPVKKFTIVVRSNDSTLGKVMLSNGADSAVYKEGAEVTIMAEPMGEKNYFVNWVRVKADGSEEEFSISPTHTFKATENMVLTAYFDSETCKAYPYVKNRVIYLSKPMGHVQIYNLHGQLLYEGRSIAFAVPAKGVYILYVTDCRKRIKVMVP